ncbi:MAG: electron transfer flavoprotein subunit alpha/FixB family protein [candidate division NC10 bacterium]|nr:electron transfer flavoprotein subunit alpha/FixB family protein [candidate division NC10 bacterium]
MAGGVWVFAEHRDGSLRKVTLEAMSAGKGLAGLLGEELAAVLMGEGVAPLADTLAHHGAQKVFLAQDSSLAKYTTNAYATVLSQLVLQNQPSILLFGATAQGRDLAPRVAMRLEAPLASDCTALSLDEKGRLVATRPIYAGKVIATVLAEGSSQMATLRPNMVPISEPDSLRKAEVVKVSAGPSPEGIRTRILEVVQEVAGAVDLAEADIIVSGGRGIKGPENFAIIRELASVLRAAVGASRAAVDAGWIPHQHQVGQTGKVVSPKLYIACGISGAIQHLAGMRSSKCIVAINKDPEAPIFKVADYGIVGDFFQVVPLLTEEFKKLLVEG